MTWRQRDPDTGHVHEEFTDDDMANVLTLVAAGLWPRWGMQLEPDNESTVSVRNPVSGEHQSPFRHEPLGAAKLRMDNAYQDGHESTRFAFLPAPTGDAAIWLSEADEVFNLTGDGHGISGLGSCCEVTIVECEQRPDIVGLAHEWID